MGVSHGSGLIIGQTHRELPAQFLRSSKPLDATLVLASFGSSLPYNRHVFDLSVRLDPNAPLPAVEKPLRYGKLSDIHHTFKADPKSPPKIITMIFTAAVVAALPLLLGSVRRTLTSGKISADYHYDCSGFHLVQTSTTCRWPFRRHRSRMPCSTAQSWRWRGSSSCIIPAGTYFRHSQLQLALGWSRF